MSFKTGIAPLNGKDFADMDRYEIMECINPLFDFEIVRLIKQLIDNWREDKEEK